MTRKKSKYYDYDFHPINLEQASVNPQGKGYQAFQSFLPVRTQKVTLGEGNTPLTKAPALSRQYKHPIFIKHEHLNPTGSFKDRESMMSINWLLENRKSVDTIAVASSGNAAISTAAFARAAKMRCTCFIPKNTAAGKKKLISLYGAEYTEIDGCYEDVYRYLVDAGDKFGVNVTAGIDPMRVEGNKTIAYEFFLDGNIPDYVIVPCGNGGNLAGIWKGFQELYEKKLISKVPKMIGVQIRDANPVSVAFAEGVPWKAVRNIPDSIAEGIIAEESYCSPKAVMALNESHGYMVEVDDAEIRAVARDVIAKESLILEPTSYAAFAALKHLHALEKDETIAVIATGSGLKVLDEVEELLLPHE